MSKIFISLIVFASVGYYLTVDVVGTMADRYTGSRSMRGTTSGQTSSTDPLQEQNDSNHPLEGLGSRFNNKSSLADIQN